ncbi:cobalamin-dependent protein [bacterium]|nr:cobalamin-dependent protein [bacterium]
MNTVSRNPKVLLISPHTSRPKYQSLPLLGVACLAAYLRERDIEVDILDATIQGITHEQVLEYASQTKPDFFGVTSIAQMHQSALKHLRVVKEKFPDIVTLIGGCHATIVHEEVIRENDFVDYCVRGEGERTAHELIERLWKGQDVSNVKGITFKRGDDVIINENRPLIEDLDSLPYPAYDLLPLHEYYYEYQGLSTKNDKIMPFMLGRGCHWKCTFCAAARMWGGLRQRSIDSVIEEIIFMREKYDMDVLFGYDDLMSTNKKVLIEFCQKYIDAGLSDIGWSCDVRAHSVDDEALRWMKKAGCRFVLFGLEFGTQRLLNLCKKGLTLSKAREAVKQAKRSGLNTCGAFMVGYPTETREEILTTARFARSLHLDSVVLNLARPYPGTEMFDYCKEHDLFLCELNDETYSDVFGPTIKLEGMTRQDIVELYAKVHRIIRWSPSYIFNKLRLRVLGRAGAKSPRK